LVDDIKAAGLTPSQLDRVLTEKYSSTLRNAEVAVIVRSFAAYRVYVGGEVNSPGNLELSANMTALQAILQAGGFKKTAELGNIVVMRNQGTQEPLFVTLDLKGDVEALNHGDMLLKPYDILFIPKSGIAKLNQFVDEYITDLIPISLNFGFVYNLNNEVEIKN
jgi:protein involved in polysaccharide export with SLBB domain